MNSERVAKAIALQVKECGCGHCSRLVEKALGQTELQKEFWSKYKWSGK